eukprot:scaffold107351_cov30-Attheya_sp.AAC.1
MSWLCDVVMWEAWGSLDVGLVEDKGWMLGNAAYNHEKLGGLTNLTSTSRMAWRKEFYDRNQDFSPDPTVTGTLHRVIYPTVSGRQVDLPFDRAELQVAGRLLDWKRRSEEVVVPTSFSKSKWVKRRLLPKELGSALDIPSDVISLGERSGKLKGWCREVRVPFKTRLRAVLEGLSKVIVEDSDWNVNGDLRRKAGQSKLSEAPRAKQQKSGEKTVELQPNSPAEQLRLHDSTSLDTIEKTPNIEKTHVRSKAWYVEDSGAADEDEAKEKKATKADDAEVPVDLWDDRIVHRVFGVNVSLARKEEITNCLNTIRKFALRFWRLKVARDFRTWWIDYAKKEKKHGRVVPRRELLDAGVEALRYAAGVSWWQWDSGSAPFFWRWEEAFLEDLATGYKPMFKEIPKPSTASVRLPQDKEIRKMMRKKLEKVIRQKYIDVSEEEILAFIQYFTVEKGLYDIRMVYNGTKSGLNDCLFAPWFALPTMTTMFRGLDVDFWCADNDFSDNFLNNLINKELRAYYCGIDVDVLMEGEVGYVKCSYTWTRCAMGLKPSPYFACQKNIRAKRYMLGDPEDDDNVFNWDNVIVNLPGNGKYDPSMPLIYKVRKDGTIAADIVCYVDDNRVTAVSEEDAWRSSSRVAKSASWLGLQDAARKRRPPSQRPGPWAGCVAYVGKDYVKKYVTQRRWEKTKAGVRWLDKELRLVTEETVLGEGSGEMMHKPIESIRGFLNYVTRTYESITPYLKGVHLTLDHWRPDRYEDGWRVMNSGDERLGYQTRKQPPATVKPVQRLRRDIDALLDLTEAESPPEVRIRAARLAMVWYIFGDASGYGLSTTAWNPDMDDDIDVDVGTWTEHTTNATSSNWKEMNNFVVKLEDMYERGQIPEGTELWLFMDNFVTKRAYHRGTSSSKQLFDLVLRLRKLQMNGKLFLHVVWVAGTRMIEQGTDGGSRGDFTTGVLRGEAMLV